MKIQITHQDAIDMVLILTKMTPEQYHSLFLEAGYAHAKDVIANHLPRNPELQEQALITLMTDKVFNFWAYFQNVAYLKNMRLIDEFGHLPTCKMEGRYFHQKIWQDQLLPHRIKSLPSSSFNRVLSVIIKRHLTHLTPSPSPQGEGSKTPTLYTLKT